MIRPCFLVVDREFPGSISTRKLVLETAKFNVITAYSGREALDIFQRFPALDGVVIDGELDDIPSEEVVKAVKELKPECPVIAICPPGFSPCPSADFQLESFHPATLLEKLRGLKPKESEQIEKHEEHISKERLT